mmetsp:Transcript_31128/g.98788  ORF Transcript_31128/g.98788 Transcript_31128/m.98788 type:complete len:266 (+) Transcript_31128:285-1082(+)
MADDDSGGPLKLFGAVALLGAIVGSSVLPMVQTASVMNKVEVVRDANGGGEIQMRSKYARLSPLIINKKLAAVPVFYVEDAKTGAPSLSGGAGKFYLDPSEADAALKAAGSGTLKAATLDEVYYPLVTKRGTFGYRSPILDKADASASYEVVGAAAQRGIAKADGYAGGEGDFAAVFQADKLAFAGRGGGGPIVPLFLSEGDLQESWSKLRKANSNLAAAPTVTANSLGEVLGGMETGAQDFSKIEFFPALPALERAQSMLQGQQ